MSPQDIKFIGEMNALLHYIPHTCPCKYAPKRKVKLPCLACRARRLIDRISDSGFWVRLEPDHPWHIAQEIRDREIEKRRTATTGAKDK